MIRAILIGLLGGPLVLIGGGYAVASWSSIWPLLLALVGVFVALVAAAVIFGAEQSAPALPGVDHYPEATARLATIRDRETADGIARRAFDPNPDAVHASRISPTSPLYDPNRLPRRKPDALPVSYRFTSKPKP